MSVIESEVSQNVLAIASLLAGVVLMLVGLSGNFYGRYGREALLAASAGLVVGGLVRWLFVVGVIPASAAIAINGFGGMVSMMLIAQAVLLGWRETRL